MLLNRLELFAILALVDVIVVVQTFQTTCEQYYMYNTVRVLLQQCELGTLFKGVHCNQ